MNIPKFKIPFIGKKTPKDIKRKATADMIIPLQGGSFLEYALMGGSSDWVSDAQAMKFYRQSSSVATAVDYITDSFVQIDPVLQDMKDGSFIDNHPLLDLLKQPNGSQTYEHFARDLSINYLLTHDGYINAMGNVERPPIELYSVNPQNVSPTVNTQDYFPQTYNVMIGAGSGSYSRVEAVREVTRYFDHIKLKELYHIMGYSSRSDNINGDSPLNAAALETNQQIKGRMHNLALLENGGRLSLMVAFKGEPVSEDEHTERKKRVNEDLGGVNNAGGIAIVSAEDVTVTELGNSNKDMDYLNLDEVASKAIYMRYKIPLPLVTTSASTFNNFEKAILLFYDQAVLPHAKTTYSGMSYMLLPRYDLDPREYRLTYNPESIPALMSRRLEELKIRKDINIETPDELREFLPNRGKVNGGSVIYQPANMLPLGEDIEQDDVDPEKEAKKLLERDGVE